MKRNLGSILCLSAIGVFSLLCGAASAQTSNTTTVAYVYVANSAGGNQTEISAFAADSTGQLHRVPGSPYVENAGYMVTNGKYLMSVSGSNINAYRIANNGSLTFAVSTDYQRVKPACGAANQLVFDHTGQSLYLTEYDVDCANNGVTDWSVDSATGGLNYLGMTNTGNWNVNAAYFIHNNEFAYTAYNDNCMYFSMNGFKRASNGTLTEFGPKFNSPAPDSELMFPI